MANSCVSNCIICFNTFKSTPCKNPEYFTSVFHAFCRLLDINLIEERMRWNFEQDDIPFCDFCSSVVEKLNGVYDELDALHRKISNIFEATKQNILRSGSVISNIPNELSEQLDRVTYIRHQAMKNCHQVFVNSVTREEVTPPPQKDIDLIMKVEINDEDKNGNSSAFIDSIKDEHGFQNQIDLNDPLEVVNNNACIEDNVFSSDDVKGTPDLLLLSVEAKDEIVEPAFITSDITTDPDNNKNKYSFGEKTFRRKSSLKLHLRRHLQETQRKCKNCDEIFDTRNNLDLHQRKIHNNCEGTYECDICHKGFNSAFDLKCHEITHRVTPFKCDVCGKYFSKAFNLNKHKLIHTRDKAYKCDMCDKCFTSLDSVRCHRRIHTGEKPYKCKTCDKSFTNKSHLVSHIRIHTGEKPYNCEDCGSCFSQSNGLYKHQRKHCRGAGY